MNRVIKFRTKQMWTGEWVYGHLFRNGLMLLMKARRSNGN
jgi:hypothetical protein